MALKIRKFLSSKIQVHVLNHEPLLTELIIGLYAIGDFAFKLQCKHSGKFSYFYEQNVASLTQQLGRKELAIFRDILTDDDTSLSKKMMNGLAF